MIETLTHGTARCVHLHRYSQLLLCDGSRWCKISEALSCSIYHLQDVHSSSAHCERHISAHKTQTHTSSADGIPRDTMVGGTAKNQGRAGNPDTHTPRKCSPTKRSRRPTAAHRSTRPHPSGRTCRSLACTAVHPGQAVRYWACSCQSAALVPVV